VPADPEVSAEPVREDGLDEWASAQGETLRPMAVATVRVHAHTLVNVMALGRAPI
jgi:hypothetical protein